MELLRHLSLIFTLLPLGESAIEFRLSIWKFVPDPDVLGGQMPNIVLEAGMLRGFVHGVVSLIQMRNRERLNRDDIQRRSTPIDSYA